MVLCELCFIMGRNGWKLEVHKNYVWTSPIYNFNNFSYTVTEIYGKVHSWSYVNYALLWVEMDENWKYIRTVCARLPYTILFSYTVTEIWVIHLFKMFIHFVRKWRETQVGKCMHSVRIFFLFFNVLICNKRRALFIKEHKEGLISGMLAFFCSSWTPQTYGKNVLDIKCFTFLYNFCLKNISVWLIFSKLHLSWAQKCMWIFIWRVHYCFPVLTQTRKRWWILVK
jgi:hypothetical protein